jgi:hypothetical protein
MMTFPAYAANFELYPAHGEAADHLAPLLKSLSRIAFTLRVADPGVNQGQMASDFDAALERALLGHGAEHMHVPLPPDIPQDLDFAFTFAGRSVAVEIEKANREKILRDLLKCHMYLRAGADYALIVLPTNYCHKLGVWNLFEFGSQRLAECRKYGFGTADKLNRILMLGFDQFLAADNARLSQRTRLDMRRLAAAQERVAQ